MVEFSALCHSDKSVYLEYLSTVRDVYFQRGTVGFVHEFEGTSSAVGGAGIPLACGVSVVGEDEKRYALGCGSHGSGRRFRSELDAVEGCYSNGSSGRTGVDTGVRLDAVDVDTGVERSGCKSDALDDKFGSKCSGGGSSDKGEGGNGVRGPKYMRNVRNRQRQLRNKAKKRQIEESVSWRSSSDEKGGTINTDNIINQKDVGFWNSCSEDVRKELVDSKAKMHIAENLRKEKEAMAKIREFESPVGLLNHALKFIKAAEECEKKTETSRVAGWAAAVAQSYTDKVTGSQPSSKPSLRTVSVDDSVLKVEELESLVAIRDKELLESRKLCEELKNSVNLNKPSSDENEFGDWKKKKEKKKNLQKDTTKSVVQDVNIVESYRDASELVPFKCMTPMERLIRQQTRQEEFREGCLRIETVYGSKPIWDADAVDAEKKKLKKKFSDIFGVKSLQK